MDLYYLQRTTRRLFLVCGSFLRQILGVCSIRIFAENMGDPYYEPTIVVHDTKILIGASPTLVRDFHSQSKTENYKYHSVR